MVRTLQNANVSSDRVAKPFLCLLASMLLKKKSPGLSLVQRAITVALYGNGTHKSRYYYVSDSALIYQVSSH